MAKLKDVKKFLESLFTGIEKVKGDSLLVATKTMEGEIKRRVFTNGRDSSNRRIGKYSRNPMYVSIAGAKRRYGSQIRVSALRGRGKNSNKRKFKNGKERKSMYFSGGYAEFRTKVGRQAQRVDLNLTGTTEKTISTALLKNRAIIGWLNDERYLISQALEKKYGTTIFEPTKKEVAKSIAIIEKEIDIRINKALSKLDKKSTSE